MTSRPSVTGTEDVSPVMKGHGFDVLSVEAFMRENVKNFKAPLSVGQIVGGMSNPTFMLQDDAGRRYVLRKKPPGKLLRSAHAVDREFKVIRALADTGVPVPAVYAFCEDESVIGQVFYIMEFVQGRVVRDMALPDYDPVERAALYDSMN